LRTGLYVSVPNRTDDFSVRFFGSAPDFQKPTTHLLCPILFKTLFKFQTNPISQLCAEKRHEYCKIDGACKATEPPFYIWHGIMLSSKYEKPAGFNESIFTTTIKLSFTKRTLEISINRLWGPNKINPRFIGVSFLYTPS